MSKKKKKNPIKRRVIIVLSVLLLMVCSLAGIRAIYYYIDDLMPAFRREGVVLIRQNDSLPEILKSVYMNLDPKDSASVERVLAQELDDRTIYPGRYTFDKNSTARYFARALTRGWQQPGQVIIDGRIRTKRELADRLSLYLMATSEDFMRAFKDSAMLVKYGTTPSKLFSIIVPDTYQMYWSDSPEEVIARLKKEYDIYWNEDRKAAAKAQGLTPYQVSVLASIVNEESSIKSELPKIASVYLTRLRKGIKLQACPTICYLNDYQITRVLFRHLKIDSPYNTYMYEGLPPTPICVPSKASLEAVLHPDKTKYLYFCADSSLNGSNHFSTDFAEHSKYAALYQQALDRQAAQAQSQGKSQSQGQSLEQGLPQKKGQSQGQK